MYYSTWVFDILGKIFGIFETCPNCSLGSPEQLCVVSSEAHVSFQIGSGFKNSVENQLKPCTIVHGFLTFWERFSEFSKLLQTVPQVVLNSCVQFRQKPMFRFRLAAVLKFGRESIKTMYYSTWIFVILGAIFGIFKTCPNCSLGSPEQLCVVLSEPHVSFQIGSSFLKFGRESIKTMYYSTWIFVILGAIFGIFETCPNCSLGSPEQLCVVSSEAHVSFSIGSGFKNSVENQLKPCTIVHGLLSFWVRFSEFSKLVQTVPQVVLNSCVQFRLKPMFRFRLAAVLKIRSKIN